MRKPRLLDLYCCAGGGAKGYQRAGFYVVGVDNRPQPRYAGDEFVQADALEYLSEHGQEFVLIHASPPCERYSIMTPKEVKHLHPDLIGVTRIALEKTGVQYVIENVRGASRLLVNPLMLCGSMFGLPIFRHRFFEIKDMFFLSPAVCRHGFVPILITGRGMRYINGRRKGREKIAVKRKATDIDWMTDAEITEAIPPAYTEWIGRQMLPAIGARIVAADSIPRNIGEAGGES